MAEITQDQLDEAARAHAAAAEVHQADPADEAAKATYREASESLAALRQAHREQEVAAGRRAAPGTGAEGVAAPDGVEAPSDLPSGA